MSIYELYQSPVVIVSLALCGLLLAYTIAQWFRSLIGTVTETVAFAGISREEMLSMEAAKIFNVRLDRLLQTVLAIEKHVTEAPEVFQDHSWSRLIEMCEDLEELRIELNHLLGQKNFPAAARLAVFACGESASIPSLERPENSLDLATVRFWPRQTNELAHRILSRIDDWIRTHSSTPSASTPISNEFREAVDQLKAFLLNDSE